MSKGYKPSKPVKKITVEVVENLINVVNAGLVDGLGVFRTL